VIEQVDRLEAQEAGRVAALFEDDRRSDRGFEAVGGAMTHHSTETSQRLTLGRSLGVVGERVEVALNVERRPQSGCQTPLGR